MIVQTPAEYVARKIRLNPGQITLADLRACKQHGENKLTIAQTFDLKEHLGYSLPIQEFWNKLMELHPCPTVLEIGCGSGLYACFFSRLLDDLGGRWIATDDREAHFRECYEHMPTLFPSLILTKNPIALLSAVPETDQILLTVWPEANSYYMMDYIRQFRGRFIVFVGEPGVCAHDDVYKHLTQRYGLHMVSLCLYETILGSVYEKMFIWDKHSQPDLDLVELFDF